MVKELGQVRFSEIEGGLRIEVTGENLKQMLSCCCLPLAACVAQAKSDCCQTEEGK